MSRMCMILTVGVALVAMPDSVAAQPPGAKGLGPLAHVLFAPQLVIKHQGAIGLTPAQRKKLISGLTSLQSKLVPMQFTLQQNAEKLAKALAGTRVNEAGALRLAEHVMKLERDVKRMNLRALIRIKNLLTPEQQRKLKRLRGPLPPAPPHAPGH